MLWGICIYRRHHKFTTHILNRHVKLAFVMKTTSLIGYCIDRKPVLQVFMQGAQDLVKN